MRSRYEFVTGYKVKLETAIRMFFVSNGLWMTGEMARGGKRNPQGM